MRCQKPVAFVALVGPLARMPAEMLLQVTDFAKCRVADGTFVRSGHADALVHLFLFRLHLRHANFIISVTDNERLLQHHLRH